MEVIGGIILGLLLLAALGVTTLAAFALMAAFGLITDMSFRRIFFISFGLGLLAPILLAAGIGSAIAEGDLQREIQAELRDAMPPPEEFSAELREAVPQIEELQRDLQNGTLDPEDLPERLEQIIEQSRDEGVTLEGVEVGDEDSGVRIEVN